MKETKLEVLDHLLQGVMDCSDMSNLFCLLRMIKSYRHQTKRLFHLTKTFQQISKMYVDEYKEIPVVSSSFQRIYDASTVSANSSEMVEKAFNSWIVWETKAIEIYQKLLETSTSFNEKRLWAKLLTVSKTCLRIATLCKQKHTPQSNLEKSENNLITPASTSIVQRMQQKLAAKNAATAD